MQFIPFSLAIQDEYNAYFDKCLEKSADYIFFNLWAWDSYYKFQIAQSNNLIWILDSRNNALRAPIGDWANTDFTTLDFFNEERTFLRVPEKLKDIFVEQFKERAIVEEDINNNEYNYSQSSLSSLSGKAMHKKKNHYNSFKKNYDIDYRPFDSTTITNGIQHDLEALHESWCYWNDCLDDEALITEYRAIKNLLENYSTFPQITGGALYAEDNLVAFALGEKLDEATFLVHFEKAHPEYKGSFQAINKCFAEHAAANFEFINREQDLGMEGLRHAKQSYHPTHFLKKFTVTIKA